MVRIEYNPNRPDFSCDYGIARALRGLLEIEVGMPKFKPKANVKYKILVEPSVRMLRPYIVGLAATNGSLDDETIRQLIGMQEDLQIGIGRQRKKASIGMHNLDAITFPVNYKTVDSRYTFVPLGQSGRQTIRQILQSETGKEYRDILDQSGDDVACPILIDQAGNVLSFPPIINGNLTRIDTNCKNLFVEVTGTERKAAEDILAIIAITLHDAGFEVSTTTIKSARKNSYKTRATEIQAPNLETREITIGSKYINGMLGLNIDTNTLVRCLRKCRLGAKAGKKGKILCMIPRYRTDLFQTIDLVEEVAVGYGIYKLEPTSPESATTGKKSELSVYFDSVRNTLIGLGMIEAINHTLSSKRIEYEFVARDEPTKLLAVEGTKSIEYEVLRDSLIPSLMQSLSRNIHEEYPQQLFELGKVFQKTLILSESWSLAVVLTHSGVDYTSAKSVLQAFLKSCFGKEVSTRAASGSMFIPGRCANIFVDAKHVGIIGEILPLVIENFKIRMPVAAFEINLSQLLPL